MMEEKLQTRTDKEGVKDEAYTGGHDCLSVVMIRVKVMVKETRKG